MTRGASLPFGNIAFFRRCVSSPSSSTPPSRANASRSASATAPTTITLFSDEQRRRVVEGLRARDLRRRFGDVGGLVDDHRNVAGAHAERRRAAFVRGAHVRLRSGGHDEVGLPHQRECLLARHRRRQHLHEIARRADAVELGMHVLEQQRERGGAFRRRRHDDRVAAFERVDDVVRGRRSRIGRRRDRRDDADRPRDLDQPAPRVLVDDAHRFRAAEVAQEADRLAAVLGDLVGRRCQAPCRARRARPARDCAPARRSPIRRRPPPRRRAPASRSRTAAAPRVRARRVRRPRRRMNPAQARSSNVRHSGLIFAVLMTSSHFASSSLITRSNSAGVDGAASAPCANSFSFTCGSSSTLSERRVEPRDDRRRSLRRRQRAVPRVDDEVRDARLGDRRHVRRRSAALGARHGDRACRRPAFTCCNAAGIETNSELHLPADRVGHRRTAALVRDVHHVDAGLQLEELARDVAGEPMPTDA